MGIALRRRPRRVEEGDLDDRLTARAAHPSTAWRSAEVTIGPGPHPARAARMFVAEAIRAWGIGAETETAELAVAELAALVTVQVPPAG